MKANYENAVKELAALIKIDSVESEALPGMPFGKGNAEALGYALNLLEKLGFSTKNIENYCGYGEAGEGELFGILAHLDVVPVGGNWKHPPFGAVIDGSKMYGRGTMDDKGPAVAAIFAAAKLLQEGKTPKKRIRFILGSDEESGWKCMDRYAETEEMPAMGFSPDADFPVINCEKGIVYHEITAELPQGVKEIKGGTRPNVVPDEAKATVLYDKMVASLAKAQGIEVETNGEWMTLTARGKSSHASCPQDGKNALIALLGALGVKYTVFNRLYAAFSDYHGGGANLALQDKESGKLTLNLGTAETKGNQMIFNLDIRHPITYNKDDVTAVLTHELTGMEVKQGFFHLPLYVAEDNFLVVSLLDAYDSVMGTKSKPITIGGGTYARFLPLGVAFGPLFPGREATIHMPDEYIDLNDFKLMIDIYYKAIEKLCF